MANASERRTSSPSAVAETGTPSRRSGRDRRTGERITVDWPVDYGDQETYLFSYISDISSMGIFIQTQQPSPAGTRLKMCFSPPGQPKLELSGKVVWINPPVQPEPTPDRQPGMGVQFIDVTEAQKGQLQSLIQKLAVLDEEWVHTPKNTLS